MSEQNQTVDAEVVETQEDNQLSVSKGIILALTEDGRLIHEFIGKDGANIVEMEGLLEYGHRVLAKKWDEIV